MSNTPPSGSPPQFTLGVLLLVTTLVAVAAALGGGMLRAGESRVLFVMLTLAAPVATLMVAAAWQRLTRRR